MEVTKVTIRVPIELCLEEDGLDSITEFVGIQKIMV